MSATTQAFFALDRQATEEVLMIAVKDMDDLSLKNAVYTLISSYRPWILKEIIETTSKPVLNVDATQDVPVYIPPQRVRDAEEHWPYMRCKNVARAFHRINGSQDPLPRSHQGLLVYLAGLINVDVETFKKSSPLELFKDNPWVTQALGEGYWHW